MNSATRRVSRALVAFAILLSVLVSPGTTSADSSLVILAGYPTLKQQHTLTCETSAASMGSQGAVSESQLMAAMPRNPNPNLGFRGNPDGQQGTSLVDYGVYAGPVHRALLKYGYRNDVLTYATRADIKAYISGGWSVVVWMTYALQHAKARLATANGAPFILVPHEHAILVIGYDDQTVIANDPWSGGQVRYWWSQFERSWRLFGNMAVAMQPCPDPQSVRRITVVSTDTSGVTWLWPRAKNAAQYDVTVTKHTATNRVVFHGTQTQHRFTFPSPVGGATYDIAVRSMSTCGGTAPTTRLWYTLPATLPTPSPTAPQGTVVIPPTPRPTASPTAVATATAH